MVYIDLKELYPIDMIKRITQIKKFQIFADFTWPADLNEFKKFNLIYGWNGTGKTTLSNFFRQIERKKVFEDCDQFEILTENGIINQNNCSSSELNVRVFNQDYREDTIFPPSGSLNPIFIIGEEEKAKIDTINEKKLSIDRIEEESKSILIELDSINKELEKLCRNTARNIKLLLRSGGSNKYNDYECPNLREKLSSFNKNSFQDSILSTETVKELLTAVKSTSKPQIEEMVINLPNLDEIQNQTEHILKINVVSKVITRLSEDGELNQWVRKGLELSWKNNLPLCPFCEQRLPNGYLDHLKRHFNDNYNSFINEIEKFIDNLKIYRNNLDVRFVDEARFYDDLSAKFSSFKIQFKNDLNTYSEYFDSVIDTLEQKKLTPFKEIEVKTTKPTTDLSLDISNINRIIVEHNIRTKNFLTENERIKSKLEDHFSAEIFLEYISLKERQYNLTQINLKNSKNVDELKERIAEIEQGFLSHSQAADNINRDISEFLDRSEIKLSVKEYGYEITRDGIITNRLSEGEKTAISFIYFLNSLEDRNFDLSNGIVIIDDPVSSFDSTSLFNAFAFMKTKTEKAHQLFVLTHNFSFFNEVKRWMNNKQTSSHYMLKNLVIKNKRIAYLADLDELLKKYHSEYHFLFSIVYKAASAESGSFVEYYPLPNISRRLLESFLAFKIPNKLNLYDKISSISSTDLENSKKLRIYRFIQEKSHADYISSDHHDNFSALGEAQSALKNILELIEKIDPDHFNAMKAIIVDNTLN